MYEETGGGGGGGDDEVDRRKKSAFEKRQHVRFRVVKKLIVPCMRV